MNIVLTSGEPAGIGPDICLKAFNHSILDDILRQNKILLLGNQDVFIKRAQMLNIDFAKIKNKVDFYDLPLAEKLIIGKPSTLNAMYVMLQIDIAISSCTKSGFQAMVTCPIQKSSIINAGFNDFCGHTEYIAKCTNTPLPIMMLANEKIKVVPLTTHIPLSKINNYLNKDLIISSLEIIHSELINKYKIAQPTIAVLGLNPHAGESGKIGYEEINIITPAINIFLQKHPTAKVIGPLSADTAFLLNQRTPIDLFLGMYHDQVLPVFKTLTFGKGVNVTLGLPIIRTSVDHGTALEIAGTGLADESGLIRAISEAVYLANKN